jgi:hypothetical protein
MNFHHEIDLVETSTWPSRYGGREVMADADAPGSILQRVDA